MKRSIVLRLGLATVCVVVASCGETQPPPIKVEHKVTYNLLMDPEFTFDDMAAIVPFSDEDAETIESIFQAREQEYLAWKQGRADTGADQNPAKRDKAAAEGNEQLYRSFQIRIDASLRKLNGRLHEKERSVLLVLDDDALDTWHSHLVANKLLLLMEPLGLSEDQKRQAHQWSPAIVQEFPRSGGAERLAPAFKRLEAKMEQDSLTEKQRGEYAEFKKANPLRDLQW